MKVIKLEINKSEVEFSREELGILNNALNEVCNNCDFEFSSKIGAYPDQVNLLLEDINNLIYKIDNFINNNKICRICWLFQENYPWWENWKRPSFDVCDCFLALFSYDDCNLDHIMQLREKWLSSWAKFFNLKNKPYRWDLKNN